MYFPRSSQSKSPQPEPEPEPAMSLEDQLSAHLAAHHMKDWNSAIYAFFEPRPCIITNMDGWSAHVFKCCAHGCKKTIRWFLDTGDVWSMSNLQKHVKSCWGQQVLEAANDAKDADEVRTKIVLNTLWNGSITTAFKRKGKGKLTYLHQQHTQQETK
ncbi:hypothetical protein J3R83DRAFT_7099 [Lanmaoa asiatica]|nr:hypothetical protein J3R83DRAFT_7099 [Lanmaoa asiatica]